MISDRVRDLLIEQVGHELSAHQTYYGISLYFEGQSLKRWARLFHGQSVEEAQHASRIVNFLVDNGVSFDLPAIGVRTTQYASAKTAVQTALESEVRVTGQFNALATAAQEAGDHRSLQFLQWFIEEQVEEERTMRELLDLIDSGINLFAAEQMLEGQARPE
ncbi:MAG TPA: ferritin [Candidatus Sulfomarinibacteraceae bacterium]|nr:ferritin [Candidatus Sulfomarinibacteraceae bacterium]